MLRSTRKAGMLDPVVVWLLLAGSRTIIGNVESSFFLSASVRNGIRYNVAYNDPRLCNMGRRVAGSRQNTTPRTPQNTGSAINELKLP
jgi:hypothetical protein